MHFPILQRVAILCIYILSLGTAYALPLELVDKLDIKAIKSISLKKTDEEFRAIVVVEFSTSADTALKFRKADFKITFQDDNGLGIYLGTTQSAQFIFPASEDGSEKFQDESLNVYVGKNDADTISRLITLFNLIGNPSADFMMILSGFTEVGTKVKRGWIYQGRVEVEDFTFHPTIQREVLFK